MTYQIFHNDFLDEALFKEKTAFIDLTITSPPYNLGIEYNSTNDAEHYEDYLYFNHQWLKKLFEITKPTGRLALNIPLDKNKGGQKAVGADITNIAKDIGWKYHSTIIWNEGNISRRTAWGSFCSASAPYVIAPVELIVILYKSEWKKNYRAENDITKQEFMEWTKGIWQFNGESKKRIGHPAPFPKELPKRCIKLFSYIGDVVFDPFLGSGTTAIEAIKNKRNFIGVEIDANYKNLAETRISNEATFLI